MGFTHTLSHWSSVRTGNSQFSSASPAPAGALAGVPADAKAGNDPAASSRLGLDQSCEQCLAFAQIATALASRVYSFPIPRIAAVAVLNTAAPLHCQRIVCVFQSRAPPVLS